MNITITADTVQIITAVTALVAVIVGPAISLVIARNQNRLTERHLTESTKTTLKQIRAETVSKARREWRELLRGEVAGLLNGVTEHGLLLSAPQVSTEEFKLSMNQVFQKSELIQLLLDPNKVTHHDLAHSMQDLMGCITNFHDAHSSGDDAKMREYLREIFEMQNTLREATREILREEWKKVKTFE